LAKQVRSPEARRYRMRRRAELVGETRRRITEAAVRLHTTIGPAATSLSAVAEEAGVTRVTLYRHFRTRDELFAACMGHWQEQHRPPDPERWREIAVSDDRFRQALLELYGWYRSNGSDLALFYRDLAAMPGSTRTAMEATQAEMVVALLDGVGVHERATRRLCAAVGHVVSFGTWRSLTIEQGLADTEAVELALAFIAAARRHRPGEDRAPRQRSVETPFRTST
jgi:AcrR family transcriptional regulator